MVIAEDAVARILAMVPGELLAAVEQDEAALRLSEPLLDLVRGMRWSVEEVSEAGEDVLGEYHAMRSPGTIVLHWDRIGGLFWHAVVDLRRAGLPLERRDLKRLATVAVQKTHAHERFHHVCDVARHLTGAPPEPLREESLAVAWAHRSIELARGQWNGAVGMLGDGAYRAFVRHVFRYAAPGYRDWWHCRSQADLEAGLVCHLVSDPTAAFLTSSGVDLAPVLLGAQGRLHGGCRETLLP